MGCNSSRGFIADVHPIQQVAMQPVAMQQKHECPICLSEVACIAEVLGCGHTFCQSCITRWKEQATTCPCCRAKMHDVETVEDLRKKLLAKSIIIWYLTIKYKNARSAVWFIHGIREPEELARNFITDDMIASVLRDPASQRLASLKNELSSYNDVIRLLTCMNPEHLTNTVMLVLNNGNIDVLTAQIMVALAFDNVVGMYSQFGEAYEHFIALMTEHTSNKEIMHKWDSLKSQGGEVFLLQRIHERSADIMSCTCIDKLYEIFANA